MILRLFLFLLLSARIFGSVPNDILDKTGMFGVVNCVLSILSAYEKGEVDEIVIDFKDRGLFYEPQRGPNWWEYYFEPIHLVRRGVKPLPSPHLPLKESYHRLIEKYIKIKPFLLQKADRFAHQYFKGGAIIGVHYRGTDKKNEAFRTSYAAMQRKIEEVVKKKKYHDYKIFLATDEEHFLTFLKEKFPKRVIATASMRSKDEQPIHFRQEEHYRAGEEAIIDALLLSKCDFLIRTQSNLSAFSSFLNPKMPVELLGISKVR
jgi:Nodulation protein Z (NodZ)